MPMDSWYDLPRKLSRPTSITGCRILIHLAGKKVAPLLGLLNAKAREALEAEGDLDLVGEGLVEICQRLLQAETDWHSAAHESYIFDDEDEAANYVDELLADCNPKSWMEESTALLDRSSTELGLFSIPITENLLIAIAAAFEGRVKSLETNLTDPTSLEAALTALIKLHEQGKFQSLQVQFLPTRLGKKLTSKQISLNFPELVKL
ncbi:MAG: DUF1517 domain-containing protein [Cyanosarcina radialis HA8281-LM2]|nr:DUF1517 domain-containing protein [Cyanosarcina radialis HA8281-LM2]